MRLPRLCLARVSIHRVMRFGALPTRNFQAGTFEGAAKIAPEQLSEARSKTRESCMACTIGCEHIYGGVRVEYESLFALGSLCGVSDSDAVLRGLKRCDDIVAHWRDPI